MNMLEVVVGYKLFIRKFKGVVFIENVIFFNNFIIEVLDMFENVEFSYSKFVKKEEWLYIIGISEYFYKSFFFKKCLIFFKYFSIYFELDN